MTMEHEYTGLLKDGAACRIAVRDDAIHVQIDRHHQPDPRKLFEASPVPTPLTVRVGRGLTASVAGLVRVNRDASTDYERQTFSATSLVIGPAPFGGTEKIAGIRFIPTNQLHAIYWTAHRSSGSLNKPDDPLSSIDDAGAIFGRYQVDVIDTERLEAARIVEDNVSIHMNVVHNENHNRQGTQRAEKRQVSIGYAEGRTLAEAVGDVSYVCAFMSVMMGIVIAPTALEFGVMDTEQASRGSYLVYSRLRSAAPELKLTNLNTGILSANYHRPAYEAALRAWLVRRDDWQKATNFALDALTMGERLDRVRFLNATGWFEAIPPDYMAAAGDISSDALNGAAKSASVVLAEHGHAGLESRVRGLIGNLNNPSLAIRLEAAVKALRVRFGQAILPSSAEEICRLVPSIRGSYAHGDDPLLGRNAGSVLVATVLIETICYLLTISGLGFSLDLQLGTDHKLTDSILRLPVLAAASAVRPLPSKGSGGAA